MQIQSGKLYENRTWKYLYPCLKYYGKELMDNLAGFFKLAVGVGDSNRSDDKNCIYILIDVNISLSSDKQRESYKNRFSKFLDWLSYKDYYIDDYVFEDIDNTGKHMIVLKIPSIYDTSYFNFVKGNYSSMYPLKTIREYFKYITISNKEAEIRQNEKIKRTRNILTRHANYLPTFVKDVNNKFGTNVEEKYFLDAEFDYPPKKEEEIFNYKEVTKIGE